MARPAATAPCARMRAGSPGRRVPADARRGGRALGAVQGRPGARAGPRRAGRSRRARTATLAAALGAGAGRAGGVLPAGRGLRSPPPARDRLGLRHRRLRARPDSEGCSLGWSTRRLPQRGANSSRLVGVSGGPAAGGHWGFNRDGRPVRGSDFVPTGFARPRLKCLRLTRRCSSVPATSGAGGEHLRSCLS